jgi:pyrimidine deaminase RibD-like protein
MRASICCRRSALGLAAAAIATLTARARAAPAEHREFIAAAFKMRDDAVCAGDQAYGAVVVKDGRVIGFGPSRVVLRKDVTAHAEREAIREAQARLGRGDLSGCVLYSSSRPCSPARRPHMTLRSRGCISALTPPTPGHRENHDRSHFYRGARP